MNAKKIFLLAILSGLVTTLFFYMFLNQDQSNAAGEKTKVAKVIISQQDIKKNEKITEESISFVEIPEDQIHSQAVREQDKVIGKFVSADIKAGEQIMMHRLEQEGEEDELVSKKVTEGLRAISISVDYVQSVSNLIEPDDHVDVVLSEQVDESIMTEAILENVRVLAVGKRMIEKDKEAPEEEYHAVTLELTQTEAVQVINASERGNLQLVLLSKRLSEDRDKDIGEENLEGRGTKNLEVAESTLVPLPERSLLREAPSLQAPVLTFVDQGTQLRYLDQQESDQEERLWFYVETPEQGTKGWISSRIIKEAQE